MSGQQLHRESIIDSNGVEIAARDYGGEGRPIVLIHGGWRTLADWGLMLPHLLPHHRVVAMELRCHGRSACGPWEWPAVANDLRAVIEFHELERPVVVGHSLGGMVATYAAAYLSEACAAAVDLDAVWLDLEQAATWATTRAPWLFSDEFDQPVTLEGLSAAIPTRLVSAYRPLPLALQAILRAMAETSDGTYALRPGRSDGEAIGAAVAAFDMPAILGDLQRPLLVYIAEHDLSPASADEPYARVPGRPERTEAFTRIAAARTALVKVETIRATHDLIIDEPETVARRVMEFASVTASHQ